MLWQVQWCEYLKNVGGIAYKELGLGWLLLQCNDTMQNDEDLRAVGKCLMVKCDGQRAM